MRLPNKILQIYLTHLNYEIYLFYTQESSIIYSTSSKESCFIIPYILDLLIVIFYSRTSCWGISVDKISFSWQILLFYFHVSPVDKKIRSIHLSVFSFTYPERDWMDHKPTTWPLLLRTLLIVPANSDSNGISFPVGKQPFFIWCVSFQNFL